MSILIRHLVLFYDNLVQSLHNRFQLTGVDGRPFFFFLTFRVGSNWSVPNMGHTSISVRTEYKGPYFLGNMFLGPNIMYGLRLREKSSSPI